MERRREAVSPHDGQGSQEGGRSHLTMDRAPRLEAKESSLARSLKSSASDMAIISAALISAGMLHRVSTYNGQNGKAALSNGPLVTSGGCPLPSIFILEQVFDSLHYGLYYVLSVWGLIPAGGIPQAPSSSTFTLGVCKRSNLLGVEVR